MRVKYPRTPHLPWSPGFGGDDIRLNDLTLFKDQHVTVTEKMDGENCTIYPDYVHARSIDSQYHSSRDWVKSLQAQIGYLIPEGHRICGENLFAEHSITYNNLDSYFLGFSVWNEHNCCLSWNDTLTLFNQLGIKSPKVLYEGIWDESKIRQLKINEQTQEGYVVRLSQSFDFKDFKSSVAKWVRTDHVTTDQHWMFKKVIANKLRGQS